MRYSNFQPIDSDCPLAAFFNSVMSRLNHLRILCAPDSFQKEESIVPFQDEKFCDFCRYETWMHAVVERLTGWKNTIDEYFTEFHGNWKYYAAYHRLSAINEWGADERDLDEDGEIRTEGLADRDYMHYTVLTDIFDEGWKDIVQDTMPSDIKHMCADLVANSRIDLLEGLRKHFGGNVQPYVQTEDGGVRPMTQEEHDLNMVSGQVDADDDAMRLMAIAGAIQGVLCMFKTCKYNDDNTELLQMATDATGAILNMDFDSLSMVMKKFGDKYVKEDAA